MAYAPPPPPQRPLGIAILAILVILAGLLLTILTGLALLAALVLAPFLLLFAAIAFILSLILLLSGIGLWNLRPWAWWLATIVVFLDLLSVIATWAMADYPMQFSDLLSLAIPLIILLYLLAVRGSFRRQTMQPMQAYQPR